MINIKHKHIVNFLPPFWFGSSSSEEDDEDYEDHMEDDVDDKDPAGYGDPIGNGDSETAENNLGWTRD